MAWRSSRSIWWQNDLEGGRFHGGDVVEIGDADVAHAIHQRSEVRSLNP